MSPGMSHSTLWDPCMPLSKELLTPFQLAQPLVTSRVTEPTFKIVFSTELCPFQHLWESSGGFFGIYFWISWEHQRGRKGKNSAMWKSFHLAIPTALAQGCGGTGGGEGRGNLPTNPMPTMHPDWEGGELLPSLAAQVLPRYKPGCQGRWLPEQAG